MVACFSGGSGYPAVRTVCVPPDCCGGVVALCRANCDSDVVNGANEAANFERREGAKR